MKLNRASDHPGANQPPGNPEGNNPRNGKGEAMKIITFLRSQFRVVTNSVTAEEKAAYDESIKTRRPQTINGNTVMAVQTGEWIYSLLENKLNTRGIKFRLGMISIQDLQNGIRHNWWTVDSLVDDCTHAWANASYAFFLKVENMRSNTSEIIKDFGLEELGLLALDSKKTSKRSQEITRITQVRASGKMEMLDYEVFDSGDQQEIFFDGPIMVRESFLLKAAFRIRDERVRKHHIWMIKSGEIGPMIARIQMDKGLIKGLLRAVPDDQINSDIVFHKSALKPEIKSTDGYWHFTAFRLNVLGKKLWDMQTAVNNHNWLYTEERFYEDLGTIVPELQATLDSGELPSWILHQHDEKHDDDGIPVIEHATAYWSDQARKFSHVRWQNNGLPISASANIIRMAFGSVVNQMTAARKRKSMWVPKSHAFAAPCITAEALTQMGGYQHEDWMNYYVWYMPNVGLVVPGSRFAETVSLHDGMDSDGDVLSVEHIMLWSSDEEVTERRKEQGIVPAFMTVPSTPEEAIHAGVMMRSPNGPGGYSIQLIDHENMPFMHTSTKLQVIDLASTPESLDDLLYEVGAQPIDGFQTYTNQPMSRDNAKEMIKAQLANPGVGSYANAIMFWAAANGPSYPDFLLTDNNSIVDICQQTADLDAFEMIAEGVKSMWDEMAACDMEVDEFILHTRVPKKFRENPDETAWTIVDGSWSRMNRRYLATIKELNDIISEGSFKIRQQSWLVESLINKIPTLSPETVQWARTFRMKYENMLTSVDAKYNEFDGDNIDRFIKMMAAANRSDEVAVIVQMMVDEIMETSYPEKYAVALYRYMIDPKYSTYKWGVSDRVIFQGGKPGQTTVMDLFIEGITSL
jgi:hypothetical protein